MSSKKTSWHLLVSIKCFSQAQQECCQASIFPGPKLADRKSVV